MCENLDAFTENLSPQGKSDGSLWKATRHLKTPKNPEPPLRLDNGSWARSNEEKALAFANHLQHVFQPNPPTNDFNISSTVRNVQNVSNPIKVSFTEIKKIIKEQLHLQKAPGHDLISNKMLTELPDIAIKIFSYMCNAMFRVGYFPKIWKSSNIKMIPKPGKDPTLVSSYRPISLLPCLSKLYEKIILAKLLPYIELHNLIPAHQFGFRRKHGTIEQVHRVANEIRKAFEERKFCSAIFLDVAQAFDKVWHEGLIYKIRQYFPAAFHKIFVSYLSERKYRIKYQDFTTDEYGIMAGVPQGSVLGPLLYLIFTADLPTSDEVTTTTFADDTALISTNNSATTASEDLQQHLLKIQSWLATWRIRVNEQKSTHVTFTLKKGDCPPVLFNGITIPSAQHVRYLGMHLDRRLTWRNHIAAKKTQINIKIRAHYWLLNKNSKLKLNHKVLLYNSIIKPIWTYGAQLWGKASASNVDIIQRAQSKILRMITGAPWYLKNSNIHKDLQIPLVKNELASLLQKYDYKIINHPNVLARSLAQTTTSTRLKRLDLPAY